MSFSLLPLQAGERFESWNCKGPKTPIPLEKKMATHSIILAYEIPQA